MPGMKYMLLSDFEKNGVFRTEREMACESFDLLGLLQEMGSAIEECWHLGGECELVILEERCSFTIVALLSWVFLVEGKISEADRSLIECVNKKSRIKDDLKQIRMMLET